MFTPPKDVRASIATDRRPTLTMSRMPLATTLLAIAASLTLLATAATAQTPRLRVNGQSAADNSTFTYTGIGKSLTVELRGTPNAKFALMLALETNGAQNGFYLQAGAGPSPQIPIHPVLDGIGSANLAAALGLPSSAFAPTTANPLFQLNHIGGFSFAGDSPVEAALFDASNPGVPYLLPFESPASGPAVAIYLQAIEVDPISAATRTSNGVRVQMLPTVLPAVLGIALSTPPSGGFSTIEIGTTNRLGLILDPNLGVADVPPISFSSAFPFDTFDAFRIELAGIEPVHGASNWGIPQPLDPHTVGSHNLVTRFASGIDVGNGSRPVRNNDNPQFPTIELPGDRTFFHYRDRFGATPRFGFGIHHTSSGQFVDLTPPAFGSFTAPSLGSPSPFEYEVLVTPDGNRALVVLDADTAKDRLFLLNLVQGGKFSNNLPVIEIPMPAEVTRIFEESFDYFEAENGAQLALFATTNASTPVNTTPPSHWRAVELVEGATPTTLLPNASFPTIANIARVPVVSTDRRVACVGAGTTPTNHDLFSIAAISASQITVTRCADFQNGGVGIWGDVTNGEFNPVSITSDGSRIAFVGVLGSQNRPYVVRTDGSDAASLSPIVKDLTEGGPFDIVDFTHCRALHLTDDGKGLVMAQGFSVAGALSDRFDVFGVDLTTGVVENLTRTIAGGSQFGPWDPQGDLTANRPTIEIGGTFVSESGDWFYFFRENRVSPFGDQFDLVAISVAPGPGSGAPTFEVVNVTGNEFPPEFGAPIPPATIPSIDVGGNAFSDVSVSATKLRRFGPDHSLAGNYVFTALRTPTTGSKSAVVIAFDPESPTTARELATFTPPTATSTAARVSQLVLDPRAERVAISLRSPTFVANPSSPGQRQDLYVLDAGDSAPPILVTDGSFSTEITAGSIRFLPEYPDGLLFGAGTLTTIQMLYDNVMEPDFAPNPVDANLFFHRFALAASIPAQTIPVLPPQPAGTDRAFHLWSVR